MSREHDEERDDHDDERSHSWAQIAGRSVRVSHRLGTYVARVGNAAFEAVTMSDLESKMRAALKAIVALLLALTLCGCRVTTPDGTVEIGDAANRQPETLYGVAGTGPYYNAVASDFAEAVSRAVRAFTEGRYDDCRQALADGQAIAWQRGRGGVAAPSRSPAPDASPSQRPDPAPTAAHDHPGQAGVLANAADAWKELER